MIDLPRAVFALLLGILALWLSLVVFLLVSRPRGLGLEGILRLLPDTLRLLKRLATDARLPRILRVQLYLVFGYLAFPIDLSPDFVPVLGHVDDVIIVVLLLRSIVKRAGPDTLRRHWGGTKQGLEALFKAAGLPECAE